MINSRDHAEAHIAAVLPAEIPCPQNSIGKSFSKALIVASTNPQYDKRFSWNYHENYKRKTWACSAHVLHLFSW